jgi:nucleoside phosphorylase
MIGLLFATSTEARPFLEAGQARMIEQKPFAVYHSDLKADLRVIVSGMGKVAAAAAAQSLILTHQVTCLVNAGACGALSDDGAFEVGRLVRISESIEGDHEIFGKRPKPVLCSAHGFADLPAVRLVTSDRPVFDTLIRDSFARLGDVVDMEGAAVARVARYHGVPCTLIKGITDHARPLGRRALLDNLSAVSHEIARKLWEVLGSAE